MKKIFIATIQIAIIAESQAEAQDAVSACLTENLQQNGDILDWGYHDNILTTEETNIKIEGYKEGDMFRDPIDVLTEEYCAWTENNKLPPMSADELLVQEDVPKTDEQKQYIRDFIKRWEAAGRQ